MHIKCGVFFQWFDYLKYSLEYSSYPLEYGWQITASAGSDSSKINILMD